MRKQKAAILLSLVLAAGSVSACTQTAGQKESSLAAESDISSVASQTDASESESTQWSDEASVDEVTSAAEESAGTISSAEGSASSAQFHLHNFTERGILTMRRQPGKKNKYIFAVSSREHPECFTQAYGPIEPSEKEKDRSEMAMKAARAIDLSETA